MNFIVDEWSPRGDYLARFEQDEERGYLLLATPSTLLAMVRVYGLDEWPDVREDEIHLQWETGPVHRCSVTVRGRRRYIDVQTGAQDAGEVRKAS